MDGLGTVVVVEDVTSMQMISTELPIYDRPIEIADLYAGGAGGVEHYVIRYPVGLKATKHRHTAAHTMVVLDGELIANGRAVGPGGYAHFPAGEVMTHEPAPGTGCTFVLIFDGPFDVHPVEG
jgi:hypothetical protein